MTTLRPTYRTALSTIGLLSALALGACSDDPVASAPRQGIKGKAPHSLYLSNPAIALLGVEISGGELRRPLLYQFPLSDGQSKQSLAIPEGRGYTAIVRGYDQVGALTHESPLILEGVSVGENRSIGLELTPVKEGEAVKVSMDVVGEPLAPEGTRIVLRADRKSVYDGESVNVKASVIDAEGRPVPIDPSELHWAIVDPRTGRMAVGKDMSATLSAYYLMNMNYASVVAIWRQIRVDVRELVLFDPYVDASTGNAVSCGLRQSGRLYCWGWNSWKMLGNTTKDSVCSSSRCTSAPIAVEGGRKFSSVSVGMTHVCAIEETTNAAFCWGSDNIYPKLGAGSNFNTWLTPTAVSGGIAFKSISAGWDHTCALSTGGTAYCWGYSGQGRLGTGGSTASTPTAVSAPLNSAQVTYTSLTAGGLHSCGLTNTAQIFCWGSLGGSSSSVPKEVPKYVQGGTTYDWLSLSPSGTAWHVCATNAIVTMCWGDGSGGQLGNDWYGAGLKSATPVLVKNSTGGTFTTVLASVSTGETHSCGLTSGGNAYCWGENVTGQLGDGSQIARKTPVSSGSGGYAKIAVGSFHTCGVTTGGDIYCWGYNAWGQVGIGTRNTPLGSYQNGVTFATQIVAPIP